MTIRDRPQTPEARPGAASDGSAGVLVDVGLPAYRRATYIGEATESVLAQTLDDWRLTVFDNGPGGGDIEGVVQPYLSDARVSYAAAGRDLSLAENWTNAIRLGTAPYVAILNDDDRWHPEFLAARVDALEANPLCGFAFGDCVQIDEQGVVTTRSPMQFAEGVLSSTALAPIFARANVIAPSAIVVRRSAYEAVGPAFDGSWHYCDWEMWARLAARFPAYYLARQDNDFRRHTHANTFANREQPAQLVAMVDHIQELFARGQSGHSVGRSQRARNRSHVLLHAAGDVHMGGGWKASGALYRRALREYPPSIVEPRSLQMLAHTIFGRKGSRALAQLVRSIGRRSSSRQSEGA